MRTLAVGALLCAGGCWAQQWEVGAALGYGLYRNATMYSAAGKAEAGIRNRFAAGAVLCQDMYEHVSGEIRYVYQDGDPFLTARGIRENLQGQSHTFVYDVLVHARTPEARMRPYFAAGIGLKLFRVSGPPNPNQPLSDIGMLSTSDTVRPTVSLGVGVKWQFRSHVILRVDFRDYITPFPKSQIVPAPFGTPRGLLQQFTPMAGISYAFGG